MTERGQARSPGRVGSTQLHYCPTHLAIHDPREGCATIVVADEAQARRSGFAFYVGDVRPLRDSATDPLVGDLVGDKRCTTPWGRYHLAYVREVVAVTDTHVVWKRLGGARTWTSTRRSWARWARGAWRCDTRGASLRSSSSWSW